MLVCLVENSNEVFALEVDLVDLGFVVLRHWFVATRVTLSNKIIQLGIVTFSDRCIVPFLCSFSHVCEAVCWIWELLLFRHGANE